MAFNVIGLIYRNFAKIVLPITLIGLVGCIIYISTIEPFPQSAKQNLCEYMKEWDGSKNISRQWWEWACLIEAEWKKGVEVSCTDLRKKGNYYICFDKPLGPKPPCLVYSFGIDNDFSFDDAMAEAGCEVFSFDP
ncbi:unnamed protein product, partial [Candidula unifasciata]